MRICKIVETQESPLRLDVKFEGDKIEASRFLLQGFQVIFFIIIPTILTILTVLTILNNTIIMPNILFTRS